MKINWTSAKMLLLADVGEYSFENAEINISFNYKLSVSVITHVVW